MTYHAVDIANWFIKRARRDENRAGTDDEFFDVVSLVRMVYIAHGWSLSLNGKPLYYNKTQAWDTGPVIPDLYNVLRQQIIGDELAYEIKKTAKIKPSKKILAQDEQLLEEVYDLYKQFSAKQLSNITYSKDGPWHAAYRIGGLFTPIPDSVTKDYYEQRFEEVGVLQNA